LNSALSAGVSAEGFLCLYKMAEQHYSSDFSVPTDSFNYYEITSSDDAGTSTLTGRIGSFPSGYGNTSEAVLVIDECEGETQTAELRVTASTINEDLSGSGYYIRLIEEFEEPSIEAFSIVLDTRDTTWEVLGEFSETGDEGTFYGSMTFTYDTTDEINTISGYMHDEFDSFVFEVSMNAVFGPTTDISGFTAGGSVSLELNETESSFNETFTEGFVFNDSATLPAIALTTESDGSDFPYYSEMTAMGNLQEVSSVSIEYQDGWDCSIPSGSSATSIDLTTTTIAAELIECEASEEALDELDDQCEDLDPEGISGE